MKYTYNVSKIIQLTVFQNTYTNTEQLFDTHTHKYTESKKKAFILPLLCMFTLYVAYNRPMTNDRFQSRYTHINPNAHTHFYKLY